jgi:sterol desaturase/sphingolipid hydroxylase (fatty acid hydroxylase superfamily)
MDVLAGLSTVVMVLAAMGALALVEIMVPLHARGFWNRAHLRPNLTLTFIAFATNLVMNAVLLALLVWVEARDFGVLRWIGLGPLAAGAASIAVLDLSWYALHRTMHRVPRLWRIHRVHHSDPAVDVTTTIRQHPAESLLRYGSLALFATTFGVGVAAFMVYRVWSVLNGLAEHANIRLPQRLDGAIALAAVSPDFHKVHHSRDVRETDTNYGNIFSVFDRVFGTYTPPVRGRSVACGLDGHDDPARQTTTGLLRQPFVA